MICFVVGSCPRSCFGRQLDQFRQRRRQQLPHPADAVESGRAPGEVEKDQKEEEREEKQEGQEEEARYGQQQFGQRQ